MAHEHCSSRVMLCESGNKFRRRSVSCKLGEFLWSRQRQNFCDDRRCLVRSKPRACEDPVELEVHSFQALGGGACLSGSFFSQWPVCIRRNTGILAIDGNAVSEEAEFEILHSKTVFKAYTSFISPTLSDADRISSAKSPLPSSLIDRIFAFVRRHSIF